MKLAIIGSGPAGCYAAEFLLKLLPAARIDIIERLPVPFGLIRYGVAPDHQGTKSASRVLDRTLSNPRVRFFGNVEVGRDITLNELRSMYHAVVLATGAAQDRRLGIPGEDLPGVIGSGAFVSWYNGHPLGTEPELNDVRSAMVIGNGNVGLDVTRILAKGAEELKGSDLPSNVFEALQSQRIEAIHIVGRRSASEAKFSPHELEELGTLQRAKPIVDPAALSGDTAVENVLRDFAHDSRGPMPVSIHFHFGLTPVTFVGDERLQAVRFRSASGEEREIEAQLAVTCIGYEAVACCSASPSGGVFANEGGKIADGCYVVGWAKRGSSGTIPTNRTEAQQVAQKIAAEISEADEKRGPELSGVLQSRRVSWVDYAGWKRIEAAEKAGACEDRCLRKLEKIEDMLRVAGLEMETPMRHI